MRFANSHGGIRGLRSVSKLKLRSISGIFAAFAFAALAGCGGGGDAPTASTPAPPTPAPVPPAVSLAVAPDTVQQAAAASLTWSSSNAASCVASGGWSGSKTVSGSESTGALTATTAYTLTCSGAGGTAGQTVTANVAQPPVR